MSKATDNFNSSENLPQFSLRGSFTFSFSGHQHVALRLGSCLVNVQYCDMTEPFIESHCVFCSVLVIKNDLSAIALVGGFICSNMRPWSHAKSSKVLYYAA